MFKPEPFKSAEDRISRKTNSDALAKRYEQLKEKDNELKTFTQVTTKQAQKSFLKMRKVLSLTFM